ncbi:lysozyme inhibitor LprI family protein [Chromobacterium phragmitis]|uniref:lysozyme inhibitor LprI family protein n=1 Tax=Chromobacterium phragmitis TaxID=2202141 RepID=UPI0011AE58E9|nr:lysozyme inhibitor LprI family protein [Chromobacterium phragmitis]
MAPLLAWIGVSAAAAPSPHRISEIIQSNPGLSSADAGLNQLYRALRTAGAGSAKLLTEQRSWLRLRDRCDNSDCLREQYQMRNAQLARQLAALPCSVQASRLTHGWDSMDGGGFFQQFELEADGAFNSWRHQHPELSNARWSFDARHCRLRIRASRHEGMDFDYAVVMTRPNRLWLLDMRDHAAGNYAPIQ